MLRVVDEFRLSGASYRAMVATLNVRNEPTPTGLGRWHIKTLQRLVERTRDADLLLRRSAAAIEASRVLKTALTQTRIHGWASRADSRRLVHELTKKVAEARANLMLLRARESFASEC